MKLLLRGKVSLFALLFVLVGCRPEAALVPDADSILADTPVVTPAAPTPESGAIVSLTAPGSRMKVGDTLEVSVEIDRVENLIGAEVHVQFDPRGLQVEDAQEDEEGVQAAHGSLLQPDFVAINISDNQSGVVDYAIAQMPPHDAVNGDGQLFKLHFTAISPGISTISIAEVVLANPSAEQIPIALLNDTLTITIE